MWHLLLGPLGEKELRKEVRFVSRYRVHRWDRLGREKIVVGDPKVSFFLVHE